MNAIFVPDKKYKVCLHRLKNRFTGVIRAYASTQMYVHKFNDVVFRHVHWGLYDEEKNLFIPNNEFITLEPKFKKQLIFPEYWFYATDETDEKILPINKITTDSEVVVIEQQHAEEYIKKHFTDVFAFLKKYIG